MVPYNLTIDAKRAQAGGFLLAEVIRKALVPRALSNSEEMYPDFKTMTEVAQIQPPLRKGGATAGEMFIGN